VARYLAGGCACLPCPGMRSAIGRHGCGSTSRRVQPQVYASTSEEFVAQMLNLDVLNAIAFDKGCYTGQEVIARAPLSWPGEATHAAVFCVA